MGHGAGGEKMYLVGVVGALDDNGKGALQATDNLLNQVAEGQLDVGLGGGGEGAWVNVCVYMCRCVCAMVCRQLRP